ncbi:DinB family protein [Arundinibacter roseus]|uniref:DinB family protein n=1 Tax=Arundinibacter roseus TaxID=2070510 RepID=A0A4R4KGM3_9BACT|nr:DinB family protein [Arundinibacter roseus]TDB66853.1 DinB family protein [Arundinibacter roseus]
MTEKPYNFLWNQFGASINMLENAILACPADVWDTDKKFWYNAFHCLFFLDYYLTRKAEEFIPPAPFTFSEFEDQLPERTYTKAELLEYVNYCRKKCRELVATLTHDTAAEIWTNQSKTMHFSVIELALYNMRHVQHHAAQLNLILRQETNDAPEWVSKTDLIL